MKQLNQVLFILITTANSPLMTIVDDFDIILESQWQDLQKDSERIKQFGGKWVVVGSITFRKKVKEAITMNRLQLQWHGKPIDNVVASLYKKSLNKNFIPLEQYLVCDGCWNKTKQTLMLNFNKKQVLGPLNIYYLVLTIPDGLEKTLHEGKFTIEQQCLPEQFKQCTQKFNISLTINAHPPQESQA